VNGPAQRPAILCVDDERDLLEELVAELNALGYAADGALSARQAEAVLARQRPDLILCDVLMPGRGGFEFLARLRRSRQNIGAIPFIFLTALANRDDQLAGHRSGADDYLTKPVDFDLLDAVIRARLDLVRRVHISAHQGQPLEQQAASLAHLSPRETEVLAQLAQGKTIGEVAQALNLSPRTTGGYVKSLYGKLGISSRAEATREALRRGLVRL
jgi:DNA-binding NarL/FixJ family response regulator